MSPFIPPFLIPLVVWLDIDPLYVISQVQSWQTSSLRFVLIRIRIGILTHVGGEVLKSLCALATLALICLIASTQIIARCRKIIEKFEASETRVIEVYKELQLWIGTCNRNFCYSAVAPLIFLGMSIIILANYITIRRQGRIPFALYVLLPGTSLIGFAIVVTMLPHGTEIHEKSVSLLRCLRVAQNM